MKDWKHLRDIRIRSGIIYLDVNGLKDIMTATLYAFSA